MPISELKNAYAVVGDIHGQWQDLCKLMDKAGPVGRTQYLFMVHLPLQNLG
jgi:hypothetical protein